MTKIIAFAGSTRKESFNKKLVKVAASAAEATGAEVTVIDLADYPLPLYDGDLEADSGLPENAAKLKKLFSEHDGLLLASPEYNGSISGVLKNTLDWLSRPGAVEGSVFAGKAAIIMSASPGGLGGLRALPHVRQILNNLQMIVLPNQHALGFAGKEFNENGALVNEGSRSKVAALGRRLVEFLS